MTQNRVLLQVLRNVFQDLRGMGLVIAGTSRLVSEVSEVFSPIPRFFRKIDLGPFPDDAEVDNAITKTMNIAKVQLLSRGIHLDPRMHEFIPRTVELSGRVPLDFNLLAYFAYDLASKKLDWKENVATLYLKLNIDVLEEAIAQLRGTKEYASFLDALTEYDRRVLGILSRCPYGASIDELTALLALDKVGENLRSVSTEQIMPLFDDFETQKEYTSSSLHKMLTLGDKYSIKALNPEMLRKAIYNVEDQWVKAYFRYSDLSFGAVSLEYGLIATDSGVLILPFGDPVSSILNSAFLHRVMSSLGESPPFKTNCYSNAGLDLYSEKGKILSAIFLRVADGKTWHMAFHLKADTNTNELRSDMLKLLVKLQSEGLVRNSSVRERVDRKEWA